MPAVLRPATRSALGRQKPPGHRLAVDWGHPLAKGLVWCVAPAGGAKGDLVSGGGVTPRSGGSWKPHAHGLALDSNTVTTADSGAVFAWAPPLATITTKCSVAAWANLTQTTWNGGVFSVPYSSAWGSPYWSLSLARTSFASSGTLYVGYSGGGSRNAVSSTNFFVDGAGDVLYGVSRDETAVAFYRNGVAFGTGTLGGNEAPFFDNQRGPGLLTHGDTALSGFEGMIGRVPFAAVWARPLTAGEWASLHAGPYQFLRPWTPAMQQYLVPAEAGGAQDTPELAGRPFGSRGENQVHQLLAF